MLVVGVGGELDSSFSATRCEFQSHVKKPLRPSSMKNLQASTNWKRETFSALSSCFFSFSFALSLVSNLNPNDSHISSQPPTTLSSNLTTTSLPLSPFSSFSSLSTLSVLTVSLSNHRSGPSRRLRRSSCGTWTGGSEWRVVVMEMAESGPPGRAGTKGGWWGREGRVGGKREGGRKTRQIWVGFERRREKGEECKENEP